MNEYESTLDALNDCKPLIEDQLISCMHRKYKCLCYRTMELILCPFVLNLKPDP